MKKYLKVYQLNGKPMIRINTNYLLKFGFKIGENIKIEFKKNKIIIRKDLEQKGIHS